MMNNVVRYMILVFALMFMLGCFLGSQEVFGQSAGIEMGVPQFFDNNGNPLNGGKLYSYSAGSSSQLFLYTNKELNVPYDDPIILNAAGRPSGPIYLQQYPYKLELYTSAGVLVWSADYQYPGSVLAGGWLNTSGVFLRPLTSNSDVLVGATGAADCCSGNGRLEVVGSEFRILSDSTANSNMLVQRGTTGSGFTIEERVNGTATHVPIYWRDGGNASMNLDATGASTSELTLGSTKNGVLNLVGVAGHTIVWSANSGSGTVTSGANTLVMSAATLAMTTGSNTFTGSPGALTLVGSGNTITLSAPTSGSTTITNGTTSSKWDSVSLGIGTTSPGAALEVKSTSTNSLTAIFNSNNTVSGTISLRVRGTEKAFIYTETANNSLQLYGAAANSTLNILTSTSYGTAALQFLSNGTEVFTADATNNAAALNILVYHGGVLQRVLLGAADSCTAGFRCLRVPN